MNPHEIPIPYRLRRFPTWHGYPIHFTVLVDNQGQPDFKSMDENKRMEAFRGNLCHLCGWKMKPPYAFIGGPRCVEAHRFIDGPMHIDCAEYATKACPFLSSPNGKYKQIVPNEYQIIYESAGNVRPAKMALVTSDTYTWGRNQGEWTGTLPVEKGDPHGNNKSDAPYYPGEITCRVGDYIRVDWDIMPKLVEPEDPSGENTTLPVVVGQHRDTLNKNRICMATFHPFKDEWYILVAHTDKLMELCVFTDKVCTHVECMSHDEAVLRLLAVHDSRKNFGE